MPVKAELNLNCSSSTVEVGTAGETYIYLNEYTTFLIFVWLPIATLRSILCEYARTISPLVSCNI